MRVKLPVGALGVKTPDLSNSARFLVLAEPDWPEARLSQQELRGSGPSGHLTSSDALVHLKLGGYVRIKRNPLQAVFHLPRFRGHDEMIHPGLGPVASVVAYWSGRLAFHAGAFVRNGRAWGLAGTNEAGKSTLLARLALTGHPIAADDALIVSRGEVLAGPRCIDLRPGTAEALGAATSPTRWGTRQRLKLSQIEPRIPLAGWFFLDWGDEVSLEIVALERRIPTLMSHRLVSEVTDASSVLELVTMPMWILRRPRNWESLSSVEAALADAVAEVM